MPQENIHKGSETGKRHFKSAKTIYHLPGHGEFENLLFYMHFVYNVVDLNKIITICLAKRAIDLMVISIAYLIGQLLQNTLSQILAGSIKTQNME